MFSYIGETEEGTIFYQVRPWCWCFCWAAYYVTEVFEICGIPFIYRRLKGIPRKPTLMEWLARYPRLWSSKKVYPPETKFQYGHKGMSPAKIRFINNSWR